MQPLDNSVLIVGTESDDPFAIDIGRFCHQITDPADILSLKSFANSEFCPRFISDEKDINNIGWKLKDATVAVVSTSSNQRSRNALAWRNCLVARAARDNGAARIILVEPDLFFSAQDRGPRPDHGQVRFERNITDYKKFDGQPFTSRFYAQALALAGFDSVITVHNHSTSVQKLFDEEMTGGILNLNPAEVFADYILHSDVTPSLHNGKGMLVCAPDKGASEFVMDVHKKLGSENVGVLYMSKQRKGERSVSSFIDHASPSPAESIEGKDVIVFDDMVRTGSTINECCQLLKEAGAGRVVFFVTHFDSSPEVRENLNSPVLDEIITTNTLPSILNRDMQGRLRLKMTVLKLERWISQHILRYINQPCEECEQPQYIVDMSSKNPRAQVASIL